jgi:hypothetical protein
VKQGKLTDTVTIKGFQPDDFLYTYMSAADGFINLRFPAMDGASWSLVEELHFSNPLWSQMQAVSANCLTSVFSRYYNREEDDILQALRRLAYKDRAVHDVGIRGKSSLRQNTATFFKVARYGKVLEASSRTHRQVSLELSLMAASYSLPVIDWVANKINSLYKQGEYENL